jgi:DNA invertase Pin-like site-specific DNA recombinase
LASGLTKKGGSELNLCPFRRIVKKQLPIIKAKERGVSFGRKKKLTREERDQLRQRREQGELIKTLMKDYNLSKASVYRYLDKTFDNRIHFILS